MLFAVRLARSLLAVALMIPVIAPPVRAASLDAFLDQIEFCIEPGPLKEARRKLSRMFPVRNVDGVMSYPLDTQTLRRIDALLPGRLRAASVTEDSGHMQMKFEIEGTYRGQRVKDIELWHGAPGMQFYGFGVEFLETRAQIASVFGPSVDWTRANSNRYRPPVLAMIPSSRALIMCSFSP
ncbi:hypothetical protein [Rhodobacter maris]|uniref:Uncharacterized protein n=1 Tax=Rhodobacter maris TaxID=446682 RepID=A0A285SD59_9RHOB|nr:hypothetical protein [Rhodobacter maris]SOC05752.1 hypothetical protein SAMN05877831_104206 [Rhodobacter maris]